MALNRVMMDRKPGPGSRDSLHTKWLPAGELLGRRRRVVPGEGGETPGAGRMAHGRGHRKTCANLKRVSKEGPTSIVDGRLRTREFEAKTDGPKQRRTEIMAARG